MWDFFVSYDEMDEDDFSVKNKHVFSSSSFHFQT